MIRWLVVVLLATILFSGLVPLLRRFGFGRLPGDFNLRLFGRPISVPLMSTLLLSLLAALIARWL
jgi:hypothetical protein